MELIQVAGKDLLTSSLIIADGMDVDHRAIMKLVDNYRIRLEKRGEVKMDMLKIVGKKSGRPTRFAWLNERQFMFIATLMKNSETVIDFKDLLTEEFDRQKKLIAHLLTQRTNAAWLEQREQGKLSRREETDTIKEFIEYCKVQGSTSAEKYYMNISKMENKALFILEQRFPNIRDVLSGQQLQIIASADIAIARALKFGMEEGMHYKEIYQLAKKRIEEFAEIVGKTPIPIQSILQNTQNSGELELGASQS